MAALKPVYQAPDLAAAERALDQLEVAWGPKYPHIIRSWRKHWDHLSVYFDFPLEIRRIIYTTNTIESFNSVVRKFTRNRLVFPHEDAVRKVVCLAIHQLSKQWIKPVRNWQQILVQFSIKYPDRPDLIYTVFEAESYL